MCGFTSETLELVYVSRVRKDVGSVGGDVGSKSEPSTRFEEIVSRIATRCRCRVEVT